MGRDSSDTAGSRRPWRKTTAGGNLARRDLLRVTLQGTFQCGFSEGLALRNKRLPICAQHLVERGEQLPPLVKASECSAARRAWRRCGVVVHDRRTPRHGRLFRYYMGQRRGLPAPCTAGTDRPRRQPEARGRGYSRSADVRPVCLLQCTGDSRPLNPVGWLRTAGGRGKITS